jgi:hypothetical protein
LSHKGPSVNWKPSATISTVASFLMSRESSFEINSIEPMGCFASCANTGTNNVKNKIEKIIFFI